MGKIFAFLVFLGITSCAYPVVTDRFYNQVYDCGSQVVEVERDSARLDINYCLADAGYDGCLLRETQYNDASIACLVMEEGAKASAKVNAGDATKATVAVNARAFIINHNMGYR
jgi:hypothetical protein